MTLPSPTISVPNDDLEVYWFATDLIKDSSFPIGFYSRYFTHNVTINTSWGFFSSLLIFPSLTDSEPFLFWIETPDSPPSEEQTGFVSLSINGSNFFTYDIMWVRYYQDLEELTRMELTYEWYLNDSESRTFLEAIYFDDCTVLIDYEVIAGVPPSLYPYNRSFSFTVTFDSAVWTLFENYLQVNSSRDWQFWIYSPSHTGLLNKGGTILSLRTQWDGSIDYIWTTIDNDSGTGQRIYVSLCAKYFFESLLNYTYEIISNHHTSSLSSVHSSNPMVSFPSGTRFFQIIFLCSLLLVLIFFGMLKRLEE